MKLKLSEILRGSVRAEISGAAPEKCLNALTDAGVGFWDAVSEDAYDQCRGPGPGDAEKPRHRL